MKPIRMQCPECEEAVVIRQERYNRCPYCTSRLFALPEETDPRAQEARQLLRRGDELSNRAFWIAAIPFFSLITASYAIVLLPALALICWPIALGMWWTASKKTKAGQKINREHEFINNGVPRNLPKYAGIVTPQ